MNNLEHILKKDTWNEGEITALFDYDSGKLINLIRSSIGASKIKPLGFILCGSEDEYLHYFDPITIYEWAMTKKIPPFNEVLEWYNEQDKPKLEDKPKLDREKPFSETERKTMLKLILGMAIEAYGFDPQKNKNEATGGKRNSISARLQTRGYEIDEDTIRKYLSQAKELI